MDEPVLTQYQDADPARPLAAYWYARACQFDSAAGYVRRRLENELDAPDPYRQMAVHWLAMDDEHRRVLLAAGEQSRWGGRVRLPADFGFFIPYREFHLLYMAMDGLIAPDCLMPPDEDEPEIDELEAQEMPMDELQRNERPAPPETAVNAWRSTLLEMANQMTRATFNTWLADARLVGYDESNGIPEYTVGVRNDYAKDWLENRLHGAILRTLVTIVHDEAELRFVVWTTER